MEKVIHEPGKIWTPEYVPKSLIHWALSAHINSLIFIIRLFANIFVTVILDPRE